jgi:predicted polyphosphate/ATP-dependent NAD kinase
MRKRVCLIVNPVAGMGGRVGLKGSDGAGMIQKAIELGAKPTSPGRTIVAMSKLLPMKTHIELITYPDDMGEEVARACHFTPRVIGSIKRGKTTGEDTKRAAKEMVRLRPDLLIFAGGDGTARDIYDAIDDAATVIGIPAGVKIHSAAYAIDPEKAGDLALLYLRGDTSGVKEVEVMDIDEDAFREGVVSARLYGYLKIPNERSLTQGAKAASVGSPNEAIAMNAIAEYVIKSMDQGCLYIVGSGTTPRAIMDRLGLDHTLLGIDVILDGELVAKDVNEAQLLGLIGDNRARIIITPIGGQGYIFGRGNQQLSPEVIRKVGVENIIVIASRDKLISLRRRPLRVDTGDRELDKILKGYVRVLTGYMEEMIYRVA